MSTNSLIVRIIDLGKTARTNALILVRNAIQQICNRGKFSILTCPHVKTVFCFEEPKAITTFDNDEINEIWNTFCDEFGIPDFALHYSPETGWNKKLSELI